MSIAPNPPTVLLATDDVLVRALLGRDLRSAGLNVWEISTRSSLEAARWYGDEIACLVVEPGSSFAGPGLHAVLEFRYLNPLTAICCLVDDETHPAVEHVPGMIPLRKSAQHAQGIATAVQGHLLEWAGRH